MMREGSDLGATSFGKPKVGLVENRRDLSPLQSGPKIPLCAPYPKICTLYLSRKNSLSCKSCEMEKQNADV